MHQFDSKLQVGSCYRIERFGCKNTDNWQRTLSNPITLLLGRYTQVTQIECNGFANHYFRFAAYNEVSQRADTRDYTLTGNSKYYPPRTFIRMSNRNSIIPIFHADYIGIIRSISHIREFGDPMTNRILRRNIDVHNLK